MRAVKAGLRRHLSFGSTGCVDRPERVCLYRAASLSGSTAETSHPENPSAVGGLLGSGSCTAARHGKDCLHGHIAVGSQVYDPRPHCSVGPDRKRYTFRRFWSACRFSIGWLRSDGEFRRGHCLVPGGVDRHAIRLKLSWAGRAVVNSEAALRAGDLELTAREAQNAKIWLREALGPIGLSEPEGKA